jgi:hypothetical protein
MARRTDGAVTDTSLKAAAASCAAASACWCASAAADWIPMASSWSAPALAVRTGSFSRPSGDEVASAYSASS